MTKWMEWSLALTTGLGLGFFFYSGLWVTVKYIAQVKKPKRFLLGSFFFRLLLVTGCFCLVVTDFLYSWNIPPITRFLFAFLGFVISRWILVKSIGGRLTQLRTHP